MQRISRWFHLAAPLLLLVSGPGGVMCGVASAAPAASAPMNECDESMPGMPSGDSTPDKAAPGDAICRAPCVLVIAAVPAPAGLAAVPEFAVPNPVRPLTGLRDPPDYPPPRDA